VSLWFVGLFERKLLGGHWTSIARHSRCCEAGRGDVLGPTPSIALDDPYRQQPPSYLPILPVVTIVRGQQLGVKLPNPVVPGFDEVD
jgi:hypothetical protein